MSRAVKTVTAIPGNLPTINPDRMDIPEAIRDPGTDLSTGLREVLPNNRI
jgi:hypothetical protein